MNSQRQPDDVAGRRTPSLDVLTRQAREPDLEIRYGDGTDQVADVYLPPGAEKVPDGSDTRYPLALFLHGGFWRAEYGREHTRPVAEALAAAGWVVCAPEYRRSGPAESGWPGTFDDVAAAVDRLPGLVSEQSGGLTDQERVVLAGHSAGGHLALWAASRHRLHAGSPWRTKGPAGYGVVALAAVSDLATCYRRGLGDGAAEALMGGGYEQHPDRYAAADPLRLIPPKVPVRLVHGLSDDRVPPEMSLEYSQRVRSAGVFGRLAPTCVLLAGTGHFELIDPLSAAWPEVMKAFGRVAG